VRQQCTAIVDKGRSEKLQGETRHLAGSKRDLVVVSVC
jgi:hypothetical protein